MGKFDKSTNYDKNAGVSSVKIGEKSPVLEVEFNEIQEISRERNRTLIRKYIGDSICGLGTISYSAGTFTIANETVIVDGEIINISSLSISASNGDDIYLDVWDEEIDYLDVIKKDGNQQESNTITNYLIDSRIGVETSRRMILAFNLSKTNATSGHRYVKLGSISSGAFVRTLKKTTSLNQLISGTIYPPAPDIAALKAIPSQDILDGAIVFVKGFGIYEYDAEDSSTPDDDLIVLPGFGVGRFKKITVQSAAQSASFIYVVSSDVTDAYTVTIPDITSWTDLIGIPILIKFNTSNIGNCTLNVNEYGAKSIVRGSSTNLPSGDIVSNKIMELVYDGTNVQLLSQGSAFVSPWINNIKDTNGSDILYLSATAGPVNYVQVKNAATGTNPSISGIGGDTDVSLSLKGQASGSVYLAAQKTNYINVQGANTANPPSISSFGTDSNIGLSLMAKGTGLISNYINGVIGFVVDAVASSVNYLKVKANIAGASPTIEAIGTDTNIGVMLLAKGTEGIHLSKHKVNWISAYGNDVGYSPSIAPSGVDTNISMSLNAKGTGSIWLLPNRTNYISVQGANTGVNPVIAAVGSDTDVVLSLKSQGAGGVYLAAHRSNYINVLGANSLNDPSINAIGLDADIGLSIVSKGNSAVQLKSNGKTAFYAASSSSNAVNYLQAVSANTGIAPYLGVLGADSNINLRLLAKGTGVIDCASNLLLINKEIDFNTDSDRVITWSSADGLTQKGFVGRINSVSDDYMALTNSIAGTMITLTDSGKLYFYDGSAYNEIEVRDNNNIIASTTKTLTIADCYSNQVCTSASAMSITIPPNIFPPGCEISFFQQGAGQLTLVPGAGVTLQSFNGKLKTAGQYASGAIKQLSTNVWEVSGNLTV